MVFIVEYWHGMCIDSVLIIADNEEAAIKLFMKNTAHYKRPIEIISIREVHNV